MWDAPIALAAAGTEGTSFSSPTGVIILSPLEVTGPIILGIVPPSKPAVMTPTNPLVSTALAPLTTMVSA